MPAAKFSCGRQRTGGRGARWLKRAAVCSDRYCKDRQSSREKYQSRRRDGQLDMMTDMARVLIFGLSRNLEDASDRKRIPRVAIVADTLSKSMQQYCPTDQVCECIEYSRLFFYDDQTKSLTSVHQGLPFDSNGIKHNVENFKVLRPIVASVLKSAFEAQWIILWRSAWTVVVMPGDIPSGGNVYRSWKTKLHSRASSFVSAQALERS